MTEIVSNGLTLLMVNRRKTPAIHELGKRQIAWLESKFPGISRNRVVRLHEHASTAYAIAERIDEARGHIARRTV